MDAMRGCANLYVWVLNDPRGGWLFILGLLAYLTASTWSVGYEFACKCVFFGCVFGCVLALDLALALALFLVLLLVLLVLVPVLVPVLLLVTSTGREHHISQDFSGNSGQAILARPLSSKNFSASTRSSSSSCLNNCVHQRFSSSRFPASLRSSSNFSLGDLPTSSFSPVNSNPRAVPSRRGLFGPIPLQHLLETSPHYPIACGPTLCLPASIIPLHIVPTPGLPIPSLPIPAS